MLPDKTQADKTTQTGSMPQVDAEPALRREAPPPALSEFEDDHQIANTGEMPVVKNIDVEDKVRDEDSPTGR